MFTLPCPRERVKDASILVLVFAATHRHLALLAAWVGERDGRHVEFRFVRFGQTIIYDIFRMIASKVNGNLHDMTMF